MLPQLTKSALETIKRLAERITAETGDAPSHIVEYDEDSIQDGGGYGGDFDPRPQWVRDEDRRASERRRNRGNHG